MDARENTAAGAIPWGMCHRSAAAYDCAHRMLRLGANLETARAQALALLGAFENDRTLMAQLAKEYETASKL